MDFGKSAAEREKLLLDNLLAFVADKDDKTFTLSDVRQSLSNRTCQAVEVAFWDLFHMGFIEVAPNYREYPMRIVNGGEGNNYYAPDLFRLQVKAYPIVRNLLDKVKKAQAKGGESSE